MTSPKIEAEGRLGKRESDALVNEIIEQLNAIVIEIEEDRKAEFFWRCIIGLTTFIFTEATDAR